MRRSPARRRRAARARRRGRGRGRGTRRVRSSETTSTGCSTTQMTVRSRRASAQIAHSSSSVRFPHSRQKRTRDFTSSIACASSSASSARAESRWNASRCAVRRPMPGSFVSCVTRFSTAGLSTARSLAVRFGHAGRARSTYAPGRSPPRSPSPPGMRPDIFDSIKPGPSGAPRSPPRARGPRAAPGRPGRSRAGRS